MSGGFFEYRIGQASLTTRIIFFVLVITLAMVGTTSFISLRIAEESMYDDLETRGEVLGPLASVMLSEPLFTGDPEGIQGAFRKLEGFDPAISTIYVAREGQMPEWSGMEPWVSMAAALDPGGEGSEETVVRWNRDGLHVLGQVSHDGDVTGKVGLVLDIGSVEGLKSRVTFWIVIMATGVLFLAMAGILVYLRTTVHKPLARLSSTARKVTAASHDISNSSQQQSAATREQSAAVSETTSAAAELAKSNEQVGDNIQKVLEVTDHAMSGMGEIKESIGCLADRIASLSEKSLKIGKITELIEDVADQTNLLAVNAAIEAARAGEHGRGFTVVADEIRKLSDSTAKSTREITALIEEIQHEISNAAVSMERSMGSVDEEVRLSKESAERAKEIAMSVGQQVSGSQQIADAIGDIDKVMKEMSDSAQQGKETANQLSVMADELKNVIESFHMSTDGDENGDGAGNSGGTPGKKNHA